MPLSDPTFRLGLPVYESVKAPTLASILGVSDLGNWTLIEGTWVDKARNDLMLAFEEDYLLMVDSDMVFERRDVTRLLSALQAHPECGAISAHYVTRKGTMVPACDWRHPTKGGWLADEARIKLAARHTRNKELTYVDSFGGGLLAITQEAKQKVGEPWFKTVPLGNNGDFLGEDTYFCQRLQEEGFKPAVHFGIPVGHCGREIYRPEEE